MSTPYQPTLVTENLAYVIDHVIRWERTIFDRKKNVLLPEEGGSIVRSFKKKNKNQQTNKPKNLLRTRLFIYVYNINILFPKIVYVSHRIKICCSQTELTPCVQCWVQDLWMTCNFLGQVQFSQFAFAELLTTLPDLSSVFEESLPYLLFFIGYREAFF